MKQDNKNEPLTHSVFAILFFASGFYGEQLSQVIPGWKDPKVGILCVVIGLLWLLRFCVERYKEMNDAIRVLKDRVQRSENHIKLLEDKQGPL